MTGTQILPFVVAALCLTDTTVRAQQGTYVPTMPRQDAYALVLARTDGTLGPNLRPAAIDCVTLRATTTNPPSRENPPCNIRADLNRFSASGLSWETFVGRLATIAGRAKIEDKTGLQGLYDWDVTFTPIPLLNHPPDRFPQVDPNGPTIFVAVEQQLGLRLVPLN